MLLSRESRKEGREGGRKGPGRGSLMEREHEERKHSTLSIYVDAWN